MRTRSLSLRVALGAAMSLMLGGIASAQVVQLPIPKVTAQGHSCGGVRITPTLAGFDENGNIQGSLLASTTCSTGGRGSRPATFTQTYLITWDFFGTYILSWNALPNPDEAASNGVAVDTYGNVVQVTGTKGGVRISDSLEWVAPSSTAAARTSQRRNSRIPVAIALKKAFNLTSTDCRRPSGSPRKIVAPATAPSRTIWPELM